MDGSGNTLGIFGDGATLNAATGFSPIGLLTQGLLRGGIPTDSSSSSSSSSSTSTGPSNTGFATDNQAFKFGNSGRNVTSFVSALQTIGKVEVLATPRLLVLNKQLAELQLGDRLGYSTFSQSIVSTTQQISFMNVGTLLRVRPFIASDGMVRMEVHPERSTGAIIDSIPQASTSEVTTNVMVPDGATLVIGGLMDKQVEITQNGIPWLSTLPGIGAFFRDRSTNLVKKELIVLLTTHIWSPGSGCQIKFNDGFPSKQLLSSGAPKPMPTVFQGKF